MGPKHVIIEGGSGVRHGESEPVVVDLKSFIQIQVILLLNGYPFLDLPLSSVLPLSVRWLLPIGCCGLIV